MISIDQNSNSLWDTLPKLQALEKAGIKFTHCVEDIDVAFTRVGAHSDQLELTLEQYYPNGNLDWGASLFYMNFLGRCPLNLNDLTKYTGETPAHTAKKLHISLEELYAKYSVADNWQLTAPSYIDSSKQAHRLLGDLSTTETIAFINELFDKAENDLLNCFPENSPQERIKQWFSQERQLFAELGKTHKTLADLYQSWLQSYFNKKCIIKTSQHNLLSDESVKMLKKVVKNYELFVKIYNESIEESGVELSKIDAETGDLPFFAIYEKNGHLVRSTIRLENSDELIAGELRFTVDELIDNVKEISGKALLLVIIARLQKTGTALALPLNGSLYTPAAVVLAEKMKENGFIDEELHPIKRVRFNFLESLEKSQVLIKLPEYLNHFFPKTIKAGEFAKQLPGIVKMCRNTLNDLKDNPKNVFQSWLPERFQKIAHLKDLKNQYGRDPEKRHLCSGIWKEVKELEREFYETCYQRLIDTVHTSEIEYWNSRGALLPWSIALGGEGFYNELISGAEIFSE